MLTTVKHFNHYISCPFTIGSFQLRKSYKSVIPTYYNPNFSKPRNYTTLKKMSLTAHCVETNFHEGTPSGTIQDRSKFKDVYSVGEAEKNKGTIVIFTDIFGNKYNNNQLIADAFSKAGYFVLMPDLFDNDPVVESFSDPEMRQAWFTKHGFHITGPYAKEFLDYVQTEFKPEKIFGIGHCYGARLVVQNLSAEGLLDAAAVAHASGTDFEEIEKITKPILYSCAEVDRAFNDEVRAKTQEILKKNKIFYQFDLFSGVNHGYSVRGDYNDPIQKYAIEKTLQDHIYWFNYHSA